jgi:alkylated DNA repair dioxygenase AlkB
MENQLVFEEIELKSGCYLTYFPEFIGEVESSLLMKKLLKVMPWEQEKIVMFGKQVSQPRLTAWMGIGASAVTRYSTETKALPWSDEMMVIKNKVEQLSESTFNSVLLNYYRDGNDSMGFHSDDEPVLGRNPKIASLSLGGVRKLIFKDKTDLKTSFTINLKHGSLLVMSGATQHEYKHGINKSKTMTDERLNLTFRWMNIDILRSNKT